MSARNPLRLRGATLWKVGKEKRLSRGEGKKKKILY